MTNINAFIAKLLTGHIEVLVIETSPGRGALHNLLLEIPDLVVIDVASGITTPDDLFNRLKVAVDKTVVLSIEGSDLSDELQQAIANVYRTRQIPASSAYGQVADGVIRHAPLAASAEFTGKLIIKTFRPLSAITCDMPGVEIVTW